MTQHHKTRVLVTGATGFLGGNIIKAMEGNSRIECIAACRNRSRLTPNFPGEVREGDLLDPQYRRDLVKDIDVICHAGTWHPCGITKSWNTSGFTYPPAT